MKANCSDDSGQTPEKMKIHNPQMKEKKEAKGGRAGDGSIGHKAVNDSKIYLARHVEEA